MIFCIFALVCGYFDFGANSETNRFFFSISFSENLNKKVNMSADTDDEDQGMVSHNSSVRRLVLRNPAFPKTPGGPSKPPNVIPKAFMNLNNQNVNAGARIEPLMTATPIRGPKRFMKVVLPVVSPVHENNEDDDFDDDSNEDSNDEQGEFIRDDFEPEENHTILKSAAKSPKKVASTIRPPPPIKNSQQENNLNVSNKSINKSASKKQNTRYSDRQKLTPKTSNTSAASIPPPDCSPIEKSQEENILDDSIRSTNKSASKNQNTRCSDRKKMTPKTSNTSLIRQETPKISTTNKISKARKKLSIAAQNKTDPDLETGT